MKHSRIFLSFGFTALLCGICSAQTNIQNDIIVVDNYIGVINNNKVKFHAYHYGNSEVFYPDLSLPDGYKGVFGAGGGIGVIGNDNIIRFYECKNSTWKTASDLNMSLPKDYKGVFYFDSYCLGVISGDNIIQFYEYAETDSSWRIDTDLEINMSKIPLPTGYKDALGFENCVGIITCDNTIQFYVCLPAVWGDDTSWSWIKMPCPEMPLPDGYKGVLGIAKDVVGIITGDDIIQFYEHYCPIWVLNGENSLKIEVPSLEQLP